jgi:glutamate racemase
VFGSRSAVQNGVIGEMLREALPEAKIYAEACPLLVPLIEAGWLKRPETRMIVKKSLLRLKVRQIDTLILADPQVGTVAALIQLKIGKRVRIVDPALAAAESVAAYFGGAPGALRPEGGEGEARFFFTHVDARIESAAAVLMKKRVKLEKAQPA